MLPIKTYRILVFILVFANLFFLSGIVSYNFVLKGEQVVVPDLTGQTLDQAKQELVPKRLAVRVREVQFNSSYEKGKIIRQDPTPGTRMKVNRTVRVILSTGSEMVVVPDLRGKTVESSVQILREVGLSRGIVSHTYTSRYAAGKIITQNPPALEKAARDTAVNVLISRGEREQKYLMPDLISMKAETVMARLNELGFKVSDVRYTYYPGYEAGIIITQLPPPGYILQKNSLITLEISKE